MSEEKRIACAVCGHEFWEHYAMDLEQARANYRGHLPHWNYFMVNGKPYCGACLSCRGCGKYIRPGEGYKAARPHEQDIRSPLCGDCRVEKSKAREGWGSVNRVATEPDGKPLKSLPKLSSLAFKLCDFVEFYHRPTGSIIQIGHFFNATNSIHMRLSQFCNGVKSYDSKGRERPPVFVRRGIVVFPQYDHKHRLLTYWDHYHAIIRAVRLARTFGYHVSIFKDHNGRMATIQNEWRKSKAEWALDVRRQEIDRELSELMREDLESVRQKYDERGERISWVDEDLPGKWS